MRRLQTFPAIGLAFSLAMLASVSAEAEALKTESAWARASAGRVAGVWAAVGDEAGRHAHHANGVEAAAQKGRPIPLVLAL